jgi:hypothetical protein
MVKTGTTTTATTSPVMDYHSDMDMDINHIHPCRWVGCNTSATTLDQLITHIRDVHIGSGKVSLNNFFYYYCRTNLSIRCYRQLIFVNGVYAQEIKNPF